MPHIHGHGQLRMHRVGGSGRPTHANLLLRRGHTYHLGRDLLFCFSQPDQGLTHHIGPHLVVESPRCGQGPPKHLQLVVISRHIANGHARERLGLTLRPDIDPHLMFLGDFLAILFLHEMNRPLPGHPIHRTLRGLDHHPPPRNHGKIMPSDGIEIEKSLLVHVNHHQTQLIHMSGQHHCRTPFGIQGRNPVA